MTVERIKNQTNRRSLLTGTQVRCLLCFEKLTLHAGGCYDCRQATKSQYGGARKRVRIVV